MSPEVTAAIIAGGVGIVTVIATVIVQIVGFRATKANTEQQIKATHKDTADTLGHQREQLDRTLAEQRTRTLNERFATAAEQLGNDKPAVRLAGIHAMAGLADDWEENRQTCIDVLCAYLRMPYAPDPGDEAPEPERLAFRASREVRHTVIRVITAHLKEGAAVPWGDLNFDLTGVVFDGGDFTAAKFSGGTVHLTDAKFSGGAIYFTGAKFSGSEVSFFGAKFAGSAVSFLGAEFSGGEVYFGEAEFSEGEVNFGKAEFSGSTVNFAGAEFSGSTVDFIGAEFSGGTVDFLGAKFSGGEVSFGETLHFDGDGFSGGKLYFTGTKFSGGEVSFRIVEFSGGEVSFGGAEFSGGTVDFLGAKFSGGTVDFLGAKFSGGTVDFSAADDWSFPPAFSRTGLPPSGLKLPRQEGQFEA